MLKSRCLNLRLRKQQIRCSSQKVIESFSDPQQAFTTKTTFELLRARLVFACCGCKLLVDNSGELLKFTTKVFGASVTNAVLRATFFGYFCAGEDEVSIKPTVSKLLSIGVGGILDYAAEADVQPQNPRKDSVISARTFEYHGESDCDENVKIFFSCISSVQNVTPEGFAAIKVTALGPPKILEKISVALKETKNLFKQIDQNSDEFVCQKDWTNFFQQYNVPESEVTELFQKISKKKEKFDYVDWTTACNFEQIWELFRKIEKNYGKKIIACSLNEEEVQIMNNVTNRLFKIAEFAHQKDVRIMIDAEQTYFQPAINYYVLLLQSKHNREKPIIFHTYQCYLVDSYKRVEKDIERAKRDNYFFAAKTVRGAYIVSERARAQKLGYPDPIFGTIEETHANYHSVVELILSKCEQPNLLAATHNQKSVEFVVRKMEELKIDPQNGKIYFGQLLGMADHLTFSLGLNGYKAYKYVPYGPVQEVIPYLIRRAQENSNLLAGGNTANEVNLISKELKRRLKFWE